MIIAALLLTGALSTNPVVVVNSTMYCAGVAVAPTVIVTAKHCTKGAASARVTAADGEETTAAVTESATDDLAALKLGKAVADPIEFAESVRVGDEVRAIGHPRGRAWTVTHGEFIGAARILETNELLLKHTALTAIGSSGGAVIDQGGRLVGVHVAATPGFGLAVPFDVVRTFVAGVK